MNWAPKPNVTAPSRAVDRRALVLTALAVLAVSALALLPRLYFLYRVTDPSVLIPSWSNDTWHRWQIAYLSTEVGFAKGFLRLWDLKGMEYYWGIVHPLLLAGLFTLTGSVDVMILRWLTIVSGALNVVFVFLIGRRFWNAQVGLAAAVLAALNPILIFNDPSGMVEPLSFVFLLAGIYFFPRRAALAGVLWALGAMTRGEAWLFSAGLLAVALVSREVPQRKFALALGWGVPIIAYMKYLADYTGNPIYPIYWNFLANAGGQWESRQGLMAYQLAARPVLAAVCLAAAAGCAWTLWKRPRAQLMYLLGFGTTSFIAGFIGLTAYLKSYEPWFWMTRFFAFPYLFAGLLLAVFFLSWLPGRVPAWGRAGLGWAAVAVTLCLMQFAWPAVLHDVNPGYTRQTSVQALRDEGLFVAKAYEGGTVLIPEVTPQFTYALGRYSGIPTSHLLGEMYGPIYYYQGPDPYAAWATVGPKMWDWLQKADITLLVMSPGDRRFTTMQQEHPERFADLGTVPHSDLELFRVNPW